KGDEYVGGIVGINELSGQINECISDGSIEGDKMSGGIVGYNLGVIHQCENKAYVNTTSHDATMNINDLDLSFDYTSFTQKSYSLSDIGGIAGYSSGILSSCINQAMIGYPHVGYNVGGIAGRSIGYILDCENNGYVYGRKDIGGIAGQNEPYVTQEIDESTLTKLKEELKTLQQQLKSVKKQTVSGMDSVTYRINQLLNDLDTAASAIENIETKGELEGGLDASFEQEHSGSITVTPPKVEVDGSSESEAASGIILFPNGGISGGVISNETEISAGLGESGIDHESEGNISSQVGVSSQFLITTYLSDLSQAIYSMSDHMYLLNSELSQTGHNLDNQFDQIEKQITSITNLALELFEGEDSDIVLDQSTTNVDEITLGKIYRCINYQEIQGDINVGGISGSMAVEIELDPEDDYQASLSQTKRKQYLLKDVIQECINYGTVLSKKNYAGGIVGKMDVGYLVDCEVYSDIKSENGSYVGGIAGFTASTIHHCYVKSTISGKDYLGGIIGSGVSEKQKDNSSLVSNCVSIVQLEEKGHIGAISGNREGEFLENYFVSDELGGVNGRSYTNKAEPISYANLIKNDSQLPSQMKQFTLNFKVEDEIIQSIDFTYGDSFDEDIFPSIPPKEGYHASWNQNELKDLHFDTLVEAVYTPYISVLSSESVRSDNRDVFLVEGKFEEEDIFEATPTYITANDTIEKFEWKNLNEHLFEMEVNQEILEQWKLKIPEDGESQTTLRYLSPSSDPQNLAVYVKDGQRWEKVKCSIIGSYLAFSLSNTESEIAIVQTKNMQGFYIIIFIIIFAIFAFIFFILLSHLKKKAPKKNQKEKKSKRKHLKTPILIIIAFISGIILTAFIFIFINKFDDLKVYELLKKYANQDQISLTLNSHIQTDDENIDLKADIYKNQLDNQPIYAISQDDYVIYYYQDKLFLENGKAYQISDTYPNYSKLLDETIKIYQNVDIEKENTTYKITANQDQTKQIMSILAPSLYSYIDTANLSIELAMDENEIDKIIFKSNGTLNNQETYQIDASLNINESYIFEIPSSLSKKILENDYETNQIFTEDIIRFFKAWNQCYHQNQLPIDIFVQANCGPLQIEDQLTYIRYNIDGKQVNEIQKNDYQLFFTDTLICDQNGNQITNKIEIDTSKLFDLIYEICMQADISSEQSDDLFVYTISLDEEAMLDLAHAMVQSTNQLNLLFDEGALQIILKEDQINQIIVLCQGNLDVGFNQSKVDVGARLNFVKDKTYILDESILEVLLDE
ncbi:MAG: hypothetical protein ACI4U3_02685, partial [Traorella sp.]